MNSKLSEERRKVVILSASLAALNAGMLPLCMKYPRAIVPWLCFLAVAFGYVVRQLVRIKRSRR